MGNEKTDYIEATAIEFMTPPIQEKVTFPYAIQWTFSPINPTIKQPEKDHRQLRSWTARWLYGAKTCDVRTDGQSRATYCILSGGIISPQRIYRPWTCLVNGATDRRTQYVTFIRWSGLVGRCSCLNVLHW
jgi:hypothetical protein